MWRTMAYVDQQTLKPDDDYVLPQQRLWTFDVLVCPLSVAERFLSQPLSSVKQSSIARHCCGAAPYLSIFWYLFSLSYPDFWLFSHLYSARCSDSSYWTVLSANLFTTRQGHSHGGLGHLPPNLFFAPPQILLPLQNNVAGYVPVICNVAWLRIDHKLIVADRNVGNPRTADGSKFS